jgi:hypothetical protein
MVECNLKNGNKMESAGLRPFIQFTIVVCNTKSDLGKFFPI